MISKMTSLSFLDFDFIIQLKRLLSINICLFINYISIKSYTDYNKDINKLLIVLQK